MELLIKVLSFHEDILEKIFEICPLYRDISSMHNCIFQALYYNTHLGSTHLYLFRRKELPNTVFETVATQILMQKSNDLALGLLNKTSKHSQKFSDIFPE